MARPLPIQDLVADQLNIPCKHMRGAIYHMRQEGLLYGALGRRLRQLTGAHSHAKHIRRSDCEILIGDMQESREQRGGSEHAVLDVAFDVGISGLGLARITDTNGSPTADIETQKRVSDLESASEASEYTQCENNSTGGVTAGCSGSCCRIPMAAHALGLAEHAVRGPNILMDRELEVISQVVGADVLQFDTLDEHPF